MVKITKKILEIKNYRETRNSDSSDDFMLTISMNLIRNLGDRNNFIHKELDYYKENNKKLDKNLKIVTGLYVCSLITCWETFFRDLFIFLCDSDEAINDKLNESLKGEIPLDLTIGEFLARKYNFQNLNQTKEAFDSIFQRDTTTLTEYFTSEVFEGVLHKDYSLIFKWIHDGVFKENVDRVLEKGFEIRHKVTHDANYLIDFDSKLLAEIECVFQIIPQFFISSFAAKYSQNRLVFNIKEKYIRITDNPMKDEKNYAFNVKDFMAEDYEIVN
ncbi:hypothetical protein [Marinifilum caeruleilacunae]|uniref:RiboL-PSP-HEPN domain-containing protein n=1 Tax=Marinifilum caeruleilacunae TaxID=2499076 RepID=A0ABX1WXF3_9BACT|nr:hypothetical protein [Marinifilum caeruleilacunae]NOU60810.1 hypothetical protein [Marinifilum caeruleilacunae]